MTLLSGFFGRHPACKYLSSALCGVCQCQCQYKIYSAPVTKRTWVHYIVTKLVDSCYIVLKAKLKRCVFSLLLKAAVS